MYESVWLDVAITLVDTDDEDLNYTAVIVHYDDSPDELLDTLKLLRY